jgi:hypothetical protein
MDGLYYVLDGKGKPVVENDSLKFHLWYKDSEFQRTIIWQEFDDVVISTIFLGINHQFGCGPPLLYETMVFGGRLDGTQQRYETELEAVEGHTALVILSR